jgi:electron transport complex protein RnfG
MKKDSILKNALILFGITLIAGLLLGFTYSFTVDAIAEQTKIKTEKALAAVMDNSSFSEYDVDGDVEYITRVYEAVSRDSGDVSGYAFQLETTEGYDGTINMMVGINADGTINGIDIISHTETPGLGAQADEDPFKSQFVNKSASLLSLVKGNSNDQNIDAIGGATITSAAVTNAVNEAITYYNDIIKEGN